MSEYTRDNLDYLKTNLKMLRSAPLEEKNGGVLIAQIPIASLDPFCEFLEEVIKATEKQIENDNVWARRAGWMGDVSGLGADPSTP